MKQPQSKTALLAHRWTLPQFSSVRTLRPQRTQLLFIAATPSCPPPLWRQGICDRAGLPLRTISGAAPSPNHKGPHLISEAPTRVTLRACQALSRVRFAMARLQWSASATVILSAGRAIALAPESVSVAQRQGPAPCLACERRLGACTAGRRYRCATPSARGWSKRRTAAG